MREAETVRDERDTVVPLELFFDLVFVFAFTQVTTLLRSDPTWGGVLRATLLLSVLWWAWSAYAWLTNTVDPEEGGVRMAMFAAIAAMLLASLAGIQDRFTITATVDGSGGATPWEIHDRVPLLGEHQHLLVRDT